jgi:hypothetical protein
MVSEHPESMSVQENIQHDRNAVVQQTGNICDQFAETARSFSGRYTGIAAIGNLQPSV